MRLRGRARMIMGWRPKKLEDALRPLMTLQGIIGHGIFHCTLKKSSFYVSIFFSSALASVFLLSVYFAIRHSRNADWLLPEDYTAMYVTFINTAIWIFAGINNWCHRTKFIQTIQKVDIIDKSLGLLGEPCDYDAIFRFNIRVAIYVFFGIVATLVIDVLWYSERLSIREKIFFSAVYRYPIHVNSVFIIHFASSIGLVTTRLAKINNILEGLASKPSYPKADFWQCSLRKNCGSFNRISVLPSRNSWEYDNRLIQIIKHIHLELCNVPKEFERFYGIQIALEMAANFITIAGLLHDSYWIYVNPLHPRRESDIIMRGFWFIVYFIKLIFVNYSCRRMTAEAERTGDIIHALRVPNDQVTYKDDIRQFAMQMILIPVNVSPAGMFTLDHRFVTKFLASVITYVVIVIQMGTTSLIRGKIVHS